LSRDAKTADAARSYHEGRREELVQIRRSRTDEYWKSPDELHGRTRSSGEFGGALPAPGDIPPAEATRRDFLALMGFTLGAASLAGCRAPVQHAIPLLESSDQIVPGVANYYATTCGGCPSACSLLVKQRDGRCIKIEGKDD